MSRGMHNGRQCYGLLQVQERQSPVSVQWSPPPPTTPPAPPSTCLNIATVCRQHHTAASTQIVLLWNWLHNLIRCSIVPKKPEARPNNHCTSFRKCKGSLARPLSTTECCLLQDLSMAGLPADPSCTGSRRGDQLFPAGSQKLPMGDRADCC